VLETAVGLVARQGTEHPVGQPDESEGDAADSQCGAQQPDRDGDEVEVADRQEAAGEEAHAGQAEGGGHDERGTRDQHREGDPARDCCLAHATPPRPWGARRESGPRGRPLRM
jgi:hypothetical protein